MNGSPAISARSPRPAAGSHLLELFRDWTLFVREALANPREVGALVPSSRTLARCMARQVDPATTGTVIELGAGTGVVTEALLHRGIPPRRLIALERSESLAELLRERFPKIHVICGDAVDLGTLLPRTSAHSRSGTCNVVSSLPLRSLPPDKVRAILREIALVLRAGGDWIQYTYALRHHEVPLGFIRQTSTRIWQNIPPARIDVFRCIPRG